MSFFAVYIPDGSPPVCSEFAERDQLLEYLRGLPADYGYCFVFADGRRLRMTADLPRYLVDGEELIPLHQTPVNPADVVVSDGPLGAPDGLDDEYASLTPQFDDEDDLDGT